MQPLSIRAAKSEDTGWASSLVLDFEEGAGLVIGAPMDQGSEVKFDPGTPVQVEIPLADGLRRFSAVVHGPGAGVPSLRLSWPEGAERIQRRDNVRVPVTFRVEIAEIRPDGRLADKTLGISIDLSAGGARIAVPRAIEPGTTLELTLHLPEHGLQKTDGRVVRRGEIHHAAGENRYWIAVEFSRIAAAVERDVTRFVFDVQRDQMRKGIA